MSRVQAKLSMAGLLEELNRVFRKIPEPVLRRTEIPLSDCVMSGLAVFSLKYPSLLQFDQGKQEPTIARNLRSLFGIGIVPCDTSLRERLDELSPSNLRGAFIALIRQAQRSKVLEQFSWYEGHYLLSVDGTGYFSSHEIHCEQCCEKHHRNGQVTYYHQMLSAALVHPAHSHVLPLAPEPIVKPDGTRKNDCERNAAKRLLKQVRQEHPHLKLVVVEDGLASNGPHIQLLQSLKMRFILGAKPSDHTYLFEWLKTSPQTQSYQTIDQDGTVHSYRYHNQVPLNETHFDLEVNCLIYEESSPTGKLKTFSWVTDIPLSEQTVAMVMRGGRARWRIENETFNTLKNQGYHFEHNFGHGKRHLSTVFAFIMLLAFLVDQLQGLGCQQFQQATQAMESRVRFWERLRAYLFTFKLPDWQTLYLAIIKPPQLEIPNLDSS